MPDSLPLAVLKEQLLALTAGQDQCRRLSADRQQRILTCVEQVEALNPTPAPTAHPELLSGNWRTIFTTSDDLLRLSGTIPGIQAGSIYQSILASEGRVFNVAELQSALPGLSQWPGGIVSVAARFSVVSDQRVQVVFEQFLVGLQWVMNYRIDTFLALLAHHPDRIAALKVPIQSRRDPAWLDITFLDPTLRISRGHRGSVFVLERVLPGS